MRRYDLARLACVGLLVPLVGCSAAPPSTIAPTASSVSSAPAGSATAPAAPSVAPGTATAGDDWTLTVAFASDITSLDPAIAYDTYSWPVIGAIFESLISYAPDSGLVPRLAAAMPEVSADGKTFTFALRDGVQFVDAQGAPVREITADDVVYSINRVLNPNLTPTPSPVAGTFFAQIEGAQAVLDGSVDEASGINAIDERTVSITLTEPNQSFLNVLAMPFGSIVPREFAGTDTPAFSAAPVGTGPYVLGNYTPGESLALVRNPHYWDFDARRASRIELALGVDQSTQIQRVQAGELDIAGDTIPGGIYTATVNDPRWANMVQRYSAPAIDYLAMDTGGDSPTADPDVRKAIAMAIDKENLLELQNGRGAVAHCIFPTTLPGHNPGCAPYSRDLEAARALLQTTDYADGFSTTLYTYDLEPGPEFAQSIQQDLAEIGIEAELAVQPFDTLLETLRTPHNAQLVHIGWIQDFPDPSDFIDPLFTCDAAVEGGTNVSWYCNAEVDRLAAEARGEQDAARRLALYRDVEAMIMADNPVVPLRFPESVYLISDRIDFEFHPIFAWDLTAPRLAGGG